MKEKRLGGNLKYLRKKHGLTQKALGEIIGKTPSLITTYENNTSTPSLDMIEKIATHFDVTIDSLLYGNPFKDGSFAQSNETDIEMFKNLVNDSLEEIENLLQKIKEVRSTALFALSIYELIYKESYDNTYINGDEFLPYESFELDKLLKKAQPSNYGDYLKIQSRLTMSNYKHNELLANLHREFQLKFSK